MKAGLDRIAELEKTILATNNEIADLQIQIIKESNRNIKIAKLRYLSLPHRNQKKLDKEIGL